MKRTRQEKLRLGLLFILVCAFFTVIISRLVHLQVYLAPQYAEIVDRQSSGTVPIPASRGIIYDRSGKVVASNVVSQSLYAYPESNEELRKVSAYLEKIFNLKQGTAVKKFSLSSKRFRWIERRLDDQLAARITREAPEGLYLREETLRDYPYGQIGKQILGFTDIDNGGKSGIELRLDSILAGRQGWADIRRDGLRNTYRVKEMALVKPEPGQSVVLTIDWCLQEILEEELQKGVLEFGAQSGMAVFLNCHNGEVLAMAHFDPTEKHPELPVKLRVVSDQFEPGSIFKAFTAAGLLDEKAVRVTDMIYCEEGKYKMGKRTLHDDKELGWLSFREVVEMSSNIGIAKFALKLGGEQMFDVYKSFGFGQKTHQLGFPGESSGRLAAPPRWSDFSVAALAMGHAVAVNSLQMANGFAVFANGGKLYRPQVILGYVDEKGNLTDRCQPDLVTQVISQETADTLRSILRGVVERGTAKNINSEIISLAGKTGTGQIPDLVNHTYFSNKYMASFAGFFPYEKPMLAGIVVLENPQPIHYGGWTSGPIFKRIAERYSILHPDLLTVPDRVLAERPRKIEKTVEVPDLVGRELAQALVMAENRGVKVRYAAEEDGVVEWQFPPAERLSFEGDEMLVLVKSKATQQVKMADLTGLSIREVSAFLRSAGIDYTVTGTGPVVKQSILPGETITAQAVCQLECGPI